ncbi:hypothetical protein F8568_019975 [Actinomadura sp. LD22]|uniref:Uncharacterized protein n=1 Tax=Actinomadura physcomitrii TaxID=2650748 RepID=A0A6I4MA45_9ACTN|nr:hypothetical protein [Actinomadura physcomitrii]MWA02612.1 hypothetical protein [Actinomadura physcomitrii]
MATGCEVGTVQSRGPTQVRQLAALEIGGNERVVITRHSVIYRWGLDS